MAFQKKERAKILSETAKEQRDILGNADYFKSLKKVDNNVYIGDNLSPFDQNISKALNYNPKDNEQEPIN